MAGESEGIRSSVPVSVVGDNANGFAPSEPFLFERENSESPKCSRWRIIPAMFFQLLLLFVSIPIIELILLIKIDQVVGLPATLAMILCTGVLGAALARWQGLRTALRIQQELAAGKMPGDALIDGLMIFVAGAVLLTPGVLTDAFGFALLTPPLRAIFKRFARRWFEKNLRVQTVNFPPHAPRPPRDVVVDVVDGKVIDAKATGTRVEDAD